VILTVLRGHVVTGDLQRSSPPTESAALELAAMRARLEAVNRPTATMARAETIDDIYVSALDAVEGALGVTRASVLVFDPDGVLRFKAWRGLSDRYRNAADGHSPWSAESTDTEPVLVPDVGTDERLAPLRPTLLAEGIGALAFFPLLQSGQVFGKFTAYYDAPHEFLPVEVVLGRLVAGHVAFAVERMRRETTLRDREREFAEFFEHAPMGLRWMAPDGTILRANQAELDLLGHEREAYVGRHMGEFHVDRGVIDDILERLARGEALHGYQARMRHRDGSIRHVLIDASGRWERGRLAHARCVTRDITDRRRADETQGRLAAIVDSSYDAIISKDLRGIIQTWNRGAERLFQYSPAEAIGHPITMLIPPERLQEEEAILDRIRGGERVEPYETVRRRKDGRRIDVSLTVSPVRDPAGGIIGASKIARDITEMKHAEREREHLLARAKQARAEAEAANRAKDEFLATLSHELRTPLNAILGWTQVLRGARHDSGIVERALDTITRNAQQQARLIEDLLDLSSIMGGRLRLRIQAVDLVSVVAAAIETVRPVAHEKEIELHTEFDPLVGAVRGDPARLQQVFWNLLTNAIKFTPQRGRVEVRLARMRSDAVLTVADSGIGIRPDLVRVIFERFRQADSSTTRTHGGLGLGLAIVRQLVEMHGGTVEATSPGEGQGSTFTVSLPMLPMEGGPRLDPAAVAGGMAQCGGVHVLLVDDEADGRELLVVYLERCGAEVTAAGSAADALAAIERRTPDVLVSDIAMPGVDGYELVRRIRARPSGESLPAIALTAHASADARVEAFRAGFDAYVPKPVDPAELTAVVSRFARRSRRPQ
jgi:PAS domain S-box-containing protein